MPPAGCTIIARNYLSHARILARSYLRHHPGATFYLLVVDDLPAGVKPGYGIRLVRPQDLQLPYFFELCFKYDVTELSTAVKPTLLQVLMRRFGEQQVVYLDPDILIARPMLELIQTLATSDIVLLPHILDPIPLDGFRPAEQDILIAGAYNLGFIAVRDTSETRRLLRWWEERLRDHCKVEPARGLMTDQKWVDLVPSLFPSTVILRDETYDVAYWNIHSRRLSRARGGGYLVNGKPLTFFHFSGFNPSKPEVFSKHQDRTNIVKRSALARLLHEYVKLQNRYGWKACLKWKYGYAQFSNGSAVHPLLKQMYLDLDEPTREACANPFQVNGATSFLRWATKPVPRTGLSPFAHRIYQNRRDVAAAFPNVPGSDRAGFLSWARGDGAMEMEYEPGLIPRVGKTKVRRSDTREKQPFGLNVVGYLRNESGLGAAARGYVRAIRRAKIPAALKDVSAISVNRSTDRTFSRSDSRYPHAINLICVNADEHFRLMSHLPAGFFKGRYNIGVWAWELPRFPEKWHDRFPYYDEIWVGSSFIVNALAPISPVPVVRIPPVLALNGPGSRASGRRRLGVRKDQFVFLFVFDFHSYAERKNPVAAIEAFGRAFGNSDRAVLVIKCVNAKNDAAAYARIRAAAKGHSIHIHDGYWSAEHMRNLMQACDAYVSLHRSEGTGLTISDAMALGKPVIATGWSGNMDFMTAANSFPVRHKLVELKRNVGPYRAGETWAQPSVEHAAELMRWVAEHSAEARVRGRAAREDIREQFSEQAIGNVIRNRLTVISQRQEFRLRQEKSHAGGERSKVVNYRGLVGRVQKAVRRVVPPGATVAVVSKGDDRLLDLERRQAWHFPRDAAGHYAGHYPKDSAAAVAHLESLRRKGAQYLALPHTAFWWLQFYGGLNDYLKTNARQLAADSDCVIFRLGK